MEGPLRVLLVGPSIGPTPLADAAPDNPGLRITAVSVPDVQQAVAGSAFDLVLLGHGLLPSERSDVARVVAGGRPGCPVLGLDGGAADALCRLASALRPSGPAAATAEERAPGDTDVRLRVLVEQMPAVMWSTDPQLRFTSSVGGGLADLGLAPGQVVGTSLYEFFGTG